MNEDFFDDPFGMPTGNKEPSTGANQPPTDNQGLPTGANQPDYGAGQMPMWGNQPPMGTAQSPYGAPQSSYGAPQPPYGVPQPEATVDYEKLSYGKIAYKRVQRLRRKGRRYGIDVPCLNYALTKPERPRILFWIMAIISAILYAGILVGVGFFLDALISSLSESGSGLRDFMAHITKPEFVLLSLGLPTTLGIFFVVCLYAFIIAFATIAVLFALYAFTFVRESFYMAICSKEEFAKGEVILKRIIGYSVILILATVLLIVGLVRGPSDEVVVKIISGVLYGAVVLAFSGPLVLMILERRKCKKWFESLDEDKKKNYLAHESALSTVRHHSRRSNFIWFRFGR